MWISALHGPNRPLFALFHISFNEQLEELSGLLHKATKESVSFVQSIFGGMLPMNITGKVCI
jgi:hypothetical protein